jgi:Uma2 family endonuclease
MAAPVLPPPLRNGDRLTRDEFLRRWEAMPDLKRAELIDGIVYMPSPVAHAHSDYHFRLSAWLSRYITDTPGCMAGTAGTWLMASDSAPQPDLALRIKDEFAGQSNIEGDYPVGAPELIIEVSETTGAKDPGAKLRLYERSGVREYLIVSPRRQRIVWYALDAGKYQEMAPNEDGWFRARVFPGLWLDPAALWNADFPGLAAAVQQGIASREHAEFVGSLAR